MSQPEVILTINGEARVVCVPPMQPLSETLRAACGLTGTKVGCAAGDCGACTVRLDGEQVCACLISTAQASGGSIETIELKGSPKLDALRQSFLEKDAAQCGICTSGMLMAAADLLDRNEKPVRAAVEDAIGGVLCRCTGYVRIVEAIMAAADGAAVANPPGGRDAVGARMIRADGPPKVNGTEIFGADTAPVDALTLRLVRSPHARAGFTCGDLEGFRVARGLVAILTADDIPGRNGFGIMPDMKEQPVLADGQVRFRGEPVLAMVGEKAALEAIDPSDLPIDWQPEDAVTTIADAKAGTAVQERFRDNCLIRGYVCSGEVSPVFETAATIVEGRFSTAFVEHAYIEPEAGFAQPIAGGRVEVFATTQAAHMDLEDVAAVLGVEADKVRIRPSACGGGFGGKLDVSLQPILAVAAMKLGRPVRAEYGRVESMASSTKRHPSEIHARAAADANGRLLAYALNADFNTGAYSSWGPTVAGRVPVHAAGPYNVSVVENRSAAWLTNNPPSGAFRGFGVPQATIANECLMDDLAQQRGMDRWVIRRVNAIKAGDRTATGQVLKHSAGLPACLDALHNDWIEALAGAAAFNARNERVRRGAGIACMWYGCGNTAMSNPSTMRLVLGRDGRLTFYNGAIDIGQGSTTVLLQICAQALGLPTSAFNLVNGDTDLTPDAGKTSASRQTFVSGNAALRAGQALREQIMALANAGADAPLSLSNGRLIVGDGPAAREIDLAALDADLEAIGTFDPDTTLLDENGQGTPYATYGFAAQIALVDVDTAYGTVKVRNIIAAHDVGRAINPTLVEGQIHGGIAQGLGLALMEEYLPGRTENLHDYLIPTVGDMPAIKTHIIEAPELDGPYGAKGVGEPALVATAPAIFSAIRHATGVTIRQAPALPHRILAALKAREETL